MVLRHEEVGNKLFIDDKPLNVIMTRTARVCSLMMGNGGEQVYRARPLRVYIPIDCRPLHYCSFYFHAMLIVLSHYNKSLAVMMTTIVMKRKHQTLPSSMCFFLSYCSDYVASYVLREWITAYY